MRQNGYGQRWRMWRLLRVPRRLPGQLRERTTPPCGSRWGWGAVRDETEIRADLNEMQWADQSRDTVLASRIRQDVPDLLAALAAAVARAERAEAQRDEAVKALNAMQDVFTQRVQQSRDTLRGQLDAAEQFIAQREQQFAAVVAERDAAKYFEDTRRRNAECEGAAAALEAFIHEAHCTDCANLASIRADQWRDEAAALGVGEAQPAQQPTVEIDGVVMTVEQFDAARRPLLDDSTRVAHPDEMAVSFANTCPTCGQDWALVSVHADCLTSVGDQSNPLDGERCGRRSDHARHWVPDKDHKWTGSFCPGGAVPVVPDDTCEHGQTTPHVAVNAAANFGCAAVNCPGPVTPKNGATE